MTPSILPTQGGWPARMAGPDEVDPTARVTAWASLIIFLFLAIWAAAPTSPAKYVLYAVPTALVLVGAAANNGILEVRRGGLLAVAGYLVIAILPAVLNGRFDFFAIRDVIIIASYLLLFAIPLRGSARMADALLATLGFCLAIVIVRGGTSAGFNILASEGFAESTLAFPLGALLLFFLHTGKWLQVVVTTVLFVLTYKRIAFAGLAFAIGFELVFWIFMGRLNRKLVAIPLVVGLSVGAMFLNEVFDDAAQLLNLENANAASLSLGRTEWAAALWHDMQSSSVLRDLFGAGPGAANHTLEAAQFEYVNPHNDWLKLLFDYGLVGLVGFHLILTTVFSANRYGTALYLYTAVLFLTDNTLIYLDYFLCVALLHSLAVPAVGAERR